MTPGRPSPSPGIDGLQSDTGDEYRAVADDGDRGYGDTLTFATEAEDGEPVK